MQLLYFRPRTVSISLWVRTGCTDVPITTCVRATQTSCKTQPTPALQQIQFKRTDNELVNDRGMTLVCSHWEPVNRRGKDQLPVVVCLHGNTSARVDAIPQLSMLLALGVTVFAFDFSGSGWSGGDYVSLGHYERDDLKTVVEFLRYSSSVSTIALWGRSMGAVTALLHGDRDPSIAAMLLDSPFADLNMLVEEMVDKGRGGLAIPSLLSGIAIRMVKSSVQEQVRSTTTP